MRIEKYRFGKMVIDGKEFTKDLKILPPTIAENWWRREGHKLHLEDIQDILQYNPEVLVVGTGAYGFMKVLPEVEEELRRREIHLIAEKTSRAVEIFNQLHGEGKKVCAAFHLTC